MRKFALALLLSFIATTILHAAELTDKDKQFLAGYEKVHTALAAEDLAGAKKAAADLGPDGSAIANSDSLATARKEFGSLNDKAVEMAKGQPGYFVAYCPMAKKSWVQTSAKISNPYEGGEMRTCGVIKK